MKRKYPFLTSVMILVIALTVFVVPFFLFLVLSLFTLIIIAFHEYQQQKQDLSDRNISGALVLTVLLLALTLLLYENEHLQWFFGVLGLFWFIKAGISFYCKFHDTGAAETPMVPAMVSTTASYDVLNTKMDALAAMIVHMFNQQTVSSHQNSVQNDDIMSFLVRLSETLSEIKHSQSHVGTNSESKISAKLNAILQDFQSKIETDINNTLETMRFAKTTETKELMNQLDLVTKTLQTIDANQASQLQALTATLQLHEEAIKEKMVQGNDAVEIISDNSAIKESILAGIEEAKDSIDICVFNITEPSVLKKLLNKEVTIRIIVDGPTLTKNMYGADSLNPAIVESLRTLNNKKNVSIKTFNSVNGKGHMHRKEMIIDRRLTLTGSANYSKNAFEHSIERLYIFKGAEYSRIHELHFDELWKGLTVDALLYSS